MFKLSEKYIDFYVINDNCQDPDDKTEEVAKQCLEGIPGIYDRSNWVSFCENRNITLELAKKHSNCDYLMVIDCDDYLEVEDPTCFDNLTAPAYHVMLHNINIRYSRVQLFKASLDSHYCGVLHEYLALPPNTSTELLKGAYMVCGHSSARASDPQKYQKDSEVLELALVDEPNNDRYIFYLAQSYRDSNALDKAKTTYLKRAKMGGWIEEIYVSLLEAAKITERLHFAKAEEEKAHSMESILQVEDMYLNAHNTYPMRAEAICHLCRFLRNFNMFNKIYVYGKVGMQIKQPETALFSESGCYTWMLIDETAIAAYYLGKLHEGAILNKALLEGGSLPECEVERIKKNLEFCGG